jgi:hypothetical protein
MKLFDNLIIDDEELVVYSTASGWISALGISHKVKKMFPDYTLKLLSKEIFSEKLNNARR